MRPAAATLATLLAASTPGAAGTLVDLPGTPPARVLVAAPTAPAGWRATVDATTGVTAALWGGTVVAAGATADPGLAEGAARGFLATHLAVLAPGAAPTDLVLAANTLDAHGTRTVAFHQTAHGVRVLGGQLHVVIAHDRVVAASSQAWPHVHLEAARTRALPAPELRARAGAWLTREAGRPVDAGPLGAPVIVPVLDAAGALRYDLATPITGRTRGGAPGIWDLHVRADGVVLRQVDRVRTATGTLTYDVGARRPTGPRMAAAAPLARITVDGAAVTTDATGALSWPSTTTAALIPSVTGALVDVRDPGALSPPTLAITPGGAVTWTATDAEEDARLSAYIHAGLGKQRARAIVPGLASWLDQPLVVHVNEAGTCNAMAADGELYFFRGGATCENSARIADIVHHELGHLLHAQGLIPGAGAYDIALSEGLSDFFAANLLDDPGLGRGFLGDAPLRDLDPPGIERVWPADRTNIPHVTGLVIAGALWDLRTRLVHDLGADAGIAAAERIYAGVLARAADVPGSYLAAQIADDDDGDLGNGTPHGCALEAAFGRHGLADPGFVPTAVAAPVVVDRTITVDVAPPTGTACPSPAVTGVRVTWRPTGEAWRTLDLTAVGSIWSGSFADVPDGTLLEYRVTATLDDASLITRPANLADPAYQQLVGPVTELWCESFEAGDPAWAHTGDAWEWGTPGGRVDAGDPPAAFAGTRALGTDLTTDGRYAVSATTAITTPLVDTRGFTAVHLQYRRWLAVEDAAYDQATITVGDDVLWTNATDATDELRHLDREWRLHDVDLSAYAGGEVAVTWMITADPSIALGGWTLDDVCIVGVGGPPDDDAGCCSAGGPGASPLLALGVLAGLRRRRRRR